MIILQLTNVTKKYNDKLILENLNLEINEGSITTIVGPSGTGKTTLFRIIAGLETPDSGTIYVTGKQIFPSNKNEIKNKTNHSDLGFVFQNYHLFPHLSVVQNLTIAPLHHGKEKAKVLQTANQLISDFGLLSQINTPINQLSGGEKQRLAIARALMLEPKILLFDEPTSALDAQRVNELVLLIKDLVKKGMTCLVITHDTDFAQIISNEIYSLESGILTRK